MQLAGSSNYELPANRFQTYIGWGRRLLAENEVVFNEEGSFESVRERLLMALSDLAAQNRPENILDCVLLDEAQDYTPGEIKLIRSFARRIFAVGDERQRIYRSSGSIAFLRKSIESVHELPFHYRNGIKICRVADGIRNLVDSDEGMETTSNYDEKAFPSSVTARAGLGLKEQVDAAIPDIERQLRAYPESFIGVLCPRNQELSDVSDWLSTSSLSDHVQLYHSGEEYHAFDTDRRVVVATIHGAKGLEFRALHLMAMDTISRFQAKQRNLAYTAVTRAKTSLSIYHQDPVPAYLDQGIQAAAGGVSKPPKLNDLFKKRGASGP